MSRFGYDGSHILWGRFWYIVSNTTDIMSSCTGEENPGETTTALASGRYSGLPRHRESIDTLFKKGMGGMVFFCCLQGGDHGRGLLAFLCSGGRKKEPLHLHVVARREQVGPRGPQSLLFSISRHKRRFFYLPRFFPPGFRFRSWHEPVCGK